MQSLEEYLQRYDPFELKCWERENNTSWESIKVGDKVMVLNCGFGCTEGGHILDGKSIESAAENTYGHDQLVITRAHNPHDGNYLVFRTDPRNGHWTRSIFLFTKELWEEYHAISWKRLEKEAWMKKNIGRVFR